MAGFDWAVLKWGLVAWLVESLEKRSDWTLQRFVVGECVHAAPLPFKGEFDAQ